MGTHTSIPRFDISIAIGGGENVSASTHGDGHRIQLIICRNVGIVIALTLFFMVLYLVATELVSAKKSKGEVLVFRRGKAPVGLTKAHAHDIENGKSTVDPVNKLQQIQSARVQKQTAVFHWKDVCFDLTIKGKPKRILDRVDGWVRPGTLTALMVIVLFTPTKY